jgi:hypothetical protein
MGACSVAVANSAARRMSRRTTAIAVQQSMPHDTPSWLPHQHDKRKRIEEPFGWMKTIGGLRKTRHRGRGLVEWFFVRGASNGNALSNVSSRIFSRRLKTPLPHTCNTAVRQMPPMTATGISRVRKPTMADTAAPTTNSIRFRPHVSTGQELPWRCIRAKSVHPSHTIRHQPLRRARSCHERQFLGIDWLFTASLGKTFIRALGAPSGSGL